MPTVIAEPKQLDAGSKGVRSLVQICLDGAANTMHAEPESLELFNKLNEECQQDLLSHILEDRQERQGLVVEALKAKAGLPLSDWEKQAGVDKNAEYIRTHAESFADDYKGSGTRYWLRFCILADEIAERSTAEKTVYYDTFVRLVENSTDSLMRFSVCTHLNGVQHHCSHPQHFHLRDLISPQLLWDRMRKLAEELDCESDLVEWYEGDEEPLCGN
ncbi:uncharacterized protein AB675_11449 [Cyphellophora attinorum]|uniref:Uncharacterized protein n=1 Tax=Cyphellophora attinorum TaxID=1664694 RepID=A0A0N1H483_9EURO|nr:uncharacterized protein AB675_11449 [Phialophora attinorum]KPI40077.1 hypothetical protein AB675_11449 [Phialophora attinorum]